jgi:glycosyltransferase involved in cell wall biosynthesis
MAAISVVVTCFNEGHYIEQAVESVLAQTRSDLIDRIVLVDDGSEQDTLDVLNRVAQRDNRIELIFEHGNGLAKNRNIACARVTSEWIAFLDADDVWHPHKLMRQWQSLERPVVGLSYTRYWQIDGDARRLEELPFVFDLTGSKDTEFDYFRFDGPIIPSTVLVRRSAFEAAGRFDPSIKVFEDTDLFLRMAGLCEFQLVPEPLVMKRVRPGAITSRRDGLMPHHAYVAFLHACRHPALLPFVSKRLADRARKLGNVEISAGDRTAAFRYYRLAASLNPLSPTLWALIVASQIRFPLGTARFLAMKWRSRRIGRGSARI